VLEEKDGMYGGLLGVGNAGVETVAASPARPEAGCPVVRGGDEQVAEQVEG